MKIVCDREKLFAAFQTAALFAPSRSPKEILTNIKLDVTKDGATFSATDLEVGARINIEGLDVDAAGSTILPVGNFGAILRESSDEKLRIDATSKGTVVRGERSEYKLPAADPEEFPDVAGFDEKKYHVISAPLFRSIIQRTEFATDMESSRYALGGVLLELEANKITAVGTDGRRLSKMEGPAEAVGGHKTGETMTIVRTPSLRSIFRAMSDNDGEVHLAARGSDVLVRTGRATFYSRLVEGRFPRWRDVFPSRRDAAKIETTVGPVLAALRQASVVLSQESRGIDFTFGDGTLTMAASTADKGQSRVEMPISYDGPQIITSLDHRFVLEYLKVLSPEQSLTIDIENGETAIVFYADDMAYGYVVMPLSRDR
ncbi:MAG: DNA polymerase III subunit beta [Pirellulaceae bacterium]|nr:DNA polymerase III subunit beta [Pirellulaceae bacterium]